MLCLQLAQMCKAVEFKDMKFRSGEKTEYTELNKRNEIQWPIKKVADTSDKVNILVQVGDHPTSKSSLFYGTFFLQLQLGGMTQWEIKVPGSNTAGECMQIMQVMRRMVACVVDLATHQRDAVMSRSALEL